MIHQKHKKSLEEITNDLCPVLSVQQLYRIRYNALSCDVTTVSQLDTCMIVHCMFQLWYIVLQARLPSAICHDKRLVCCYLVWSCWLVGRLV